MQKVAYAEFEADTKKTDKTDQLYFFNGRSAQIPT